MEGFRFLGTDGTVQVFALFVVFTLTGFLGMSCLAALTKRFGALKSAVTSTVRKGVTLILSYIIFPEGKTFTILHGVGTLIFLGGLFLESTTKLKSGPKSNSSNFTSEEDEEIGIITGDLNEAEPLLPLTAPEIDSEACSLTEVVPSKIGALVNRSNWKVDTLSDYSGPSSETPSLSGAYISPRSPSYSKDYIAAENRSQTTSIISSLSLESARRNSSFQTLTPLKSPRALA